MGNSLGVHPLEEAKVVYMPSSMRKKFTDMLSGLTILLEVPQWFHYPVLNDLARLCQGSGIIEPDHFAIIPEELLLIVVGIHVADTASHKEENDALRFRWVVNYPRARSGRLLVGECSHGESAKTTGDVPEGMSSGNVHRRRQAG